MSPPTKLTLSFLSVWHVYAVRTAQHAPRLCLHYIKHNRLTLASPISCMTSIWATTTGSNPSPCSFHAGEQGRTIPLRWNRPRANAENIKTMSHPVTYLMDPGREGWREDTERGKKCWRGGVGLEVLGSGTVTMWQCDCSNGEHVMAPWCPWANCHSNHFN